VEGGRTEWRFSFSIESMAEFAKLSGDYNPLHADVEFAKRKGFDAPLVYGMLVSSQMSRLVGQELPDNNAILTGVKMDFLGPCFPGESLVFAAELVNKSDSTLALDFKCRVLRGEKLLCRGTVSAVWMP